MDTNSSNNTSGPVTIAVNCAADVKVVKTTTTPTITAGGQASYGVTVTANGPTSSTHVVLTDTLPAGLNWTVGGLDAGSCSPASPVAGGTTLTCSFGTMAPRDESHHPNGDDIGANCPGITNTARRERRRGHQLDQQHLRGGDDRGELPRMSRTKTTTTPIIKAGEQASYNVTVTANGPTSSTHVVLTDTLPAGLTWTVGGTDQANCALLAGGTLTCTFGTMAPQATKSITLTAPTLAQTVRPSTIRQA